MIGVSPILALIAMTIPLCMLTSNFCWNLTSKFGLRRIWATPIPVGQEKSECILKFLEEFV